MPDAEKDPCCTTPGCGGDARYPAPGRSHRPGCPYPMPTLPVGTLTIPAAARLVPGDLIRVLGPGSWELVEPDDTRVLPPVEPTTCLCPDGRVCIADCTGTEDTMDCARVLPPGEGRA